MSLALVAFPAKFCRVWRKTSGKCYVPTTQPL